jgi:hypothetical protein
MMEHTSDADLVASVVGESVTVKEPNVWYLADKDVYSKIGGSKKQHVR